MKLHHLIAIAGIAASLVAPLTASAAPTVLATGSFVSGVHETKGTATIYKLDDGKIVLRLTDFETSNGPAVHVYLSAATGNTGITSGKFVDLGDLKGTTGNQNYDVPTDVPLTDYHSVSIWCSRFSVNFGNAVFK